MKAALIRARAEARAVDEVLCKVGRVRQEILPDDAHHPDQQQHSPGRGEEPRVTNRETSVTKRASMPPTATSTTA